MTLKYESLKAVQEAFQSGELDRETSYIEIDNDQTYMYVDDEKVFDGATPGDLLEAALALLVIPNEPA